MDTKETSVIAIGPTSNDTFGRYVSPKFIVRV